VFRVDDDQVADDQEAEDRAVEQDARAVVRDIQARTTTRGDEDDGTSAVVALLRKHEFEVMRRMALSIGYMIDQFPRDGEDWAKRLVGQLAEGLKQVAGTDGEWEEVID
jgi:hypothetical protein